MFKDKLIQLSQNYRRGDKRYDMIQVFQQYQNYLILIILTTIYNNYSQYFFRRDTYSKIVDEDIFFFTCGSFHYFLICAQKLLFLFIKKNDNYNLMIQIERQNIFII